MDDRPDNPRQLPSEPPTERTGPATVRPPQAPGSVADRIEPVFAIPDAASSHRSPGIFDVSARMLLDAPVSTPIHPQAGFLPPGAGLVPVGLLPGARLVGSEPDRAAQPVLAFPAAWPVAAADPIRIPSAPVSPAALTPTPTPGFASYLRTAAKYAVLAVACWVLIVASLIVVYRFANPPMSALMLQRWITGEQVSQTWVTLDGISPSLVRAVLVSEDGRFCQHGGIDLEAMQIAIEKAGDGTPRGASTISMQVAKNLFLWPTKSYVRKALEMPLTLAIETLWPKRRIMEVYLNIAEWGPGVYGVEAAARHHFRKPARELSERDAALLAVTLPNPIRRDAGEPGPGTRRLASLIQARARGASRSQTSCVLRPPVRSDGTGWEPKIR